MHAMGYLLLGRFGMYRESVTLKSDLELALSKKWEETLKRGSYVWGDIRDLWPRVHPLQGGIKLTCMQWGTYCWVALVCIESLWHWNLTLNLHYLKNGKRLWKGVVMFEVTLETFGRGFTPYKGVSNWRACNGVLIAGSLWYVLRVCDIEIWPWTCII